MLVLNFILAILGATIPIMATLFWSKTAKMLDSRFENKEIILTESSKNNLIKWVFHHRAKFNAIVAVIATIIEFFAFIPF